MDVQTLPPGIGLSPAAPPAAPRPLGRQVVGAFYLVMGLARRDLVRGVR